MGLVQQLSSGTGQYVDNFSVATTVHMPGNIGAGHTVLVASGTFTNGHNTRLSAVSAGGTSGSGAGTTANATFMLEFWEVANVTGGVDTVVVTPSNTGYYIGLGAAEFDNLDSAGAYDSGATATGSGTGTNAPTVTSNTLANADSVVLAAYTNTVGADDAITHPGTPWVTTADLPDENLHMALGADHKTVSATTAVTASWTLASSTDWITLITAFKISAGGGGTVDVDAGTDTPAVTDQLLIETSFPQESLSVSDSISIETTKGVSDTLSVSDALVEGLEIFRESPGGRLTRFFID